MTDAKTTDRSDHEVATATLRPSRMLEDAPTERSASRSRGGDESRPTGVLRRLWSDRRLGTVVAVVVTVGWALIAGIWTPRGPITIAEGLGTMVASLAVGWIAGMAMRSRWAMVVAPVGFAAVFELARMGSEGPTVDGIHTSTYGLIALVVGRGLHGMLAIAPMLLGGALGAGLARRLTEGRRPLERRARVLLAIRRTVATAAGLALIALAAAVARPASTDPIVGADGEPLPRSIAELTRVEVGGHETAMMIRGHDTADPVLLFLAGGPGGSELGAMRRHLEGLEHDFVVVTWDQRGTGKSYGSLDPTATISGEQAVRDAIEVTNHLRGRFDDDKIYLVGQSWGSLVGGLAAERRPELYHAFVGTGQMVSPRETDRIFYADTLRWARANGRDELAAKLTKLGPPPYSSNLHYESALSHEHDVYPYDHSRNSEGEGGFSENLFVEEYTLLEQIHALGAFMDTFSAMYPRIQDIDFRDHVARLEVPVYLIQGRHEPRGRADLANAWFEQLRAPSKELILLETSGHRPLFEQPDRFTELMSDTVLAQTQPRRP